MKIAVFACANGLGHVRRVIAILNFMYKNGFDGFVDAFVPLVHIKRLATWEECNYFQNHPKIQLIDFEYPKIPTKKVKSIYDKTWKEFTLPNIEFDQYDLVWSDNITQLLTFRKDAILTGSFFWHEVFSHSMRKNEFAMFIKQQRNLVDKANPIMIGHEHLATPEVRKTTRFYPVGIYRYNISFQEKTHKDILLSCGLGGEEDDMVLTAIERIIAENLQPPAILWVEPRLLPTNAPNWMQKADFSTEMFHRCAAVCNRPGLGTVSDALVNRAKVFAFYKGTMFEMEHNTKVLNKLKIGEYCESPYIAYKKALTYVNNREAMNLQRYRTAHLRMDGVSATARAIIEQKNLFL